MLVRANKHFHKVMYALRESTLRFTPYEMRHFMLWYVYDFLRIYTKTIRESDITHYGYSRLTAICNGPN